MMLTMSTGLSPRKLKDLGDSGLCGITEAHCGMTRFSRNSFIQALLRKVLMHCGQEERAWRESSATTSSEFGNDAARHSAASTVCSGSPGTANMRVGHCKDVSTP
mmetsp:Transcript_37497/g.99669  ORF Transcript_37497/g.99669 Transcript_37497/m.99669 type:complete len:105 (-) Transcript_37497:84-398(-)